MSVPSLPAECQFQQVLCCHLSPQLVQRSTGQQPGRLEKEESQVRLLSKRKRNTTTLRCQINSTDLFFTIEEHFFVKNLINVYAQKDFGVNSLIFFLFLAMLIV